MPLKDYIDSLKNEFPNRADFLDHCWEVWQYFNGYFLLQKACALQEPDACIGEEKGFMLTWRKDDHYMECEILENNNIELFYKQGNIIESEDGSLEQTFTEGMLKRMGIFVLGRAIAPCQ
jgi:hypothetical protein